MSAYGIFYGHLVEFVDEHTCGAGGEMGHEPQCGMEPVVRLTGWDDVEEFDLDRYAAAVDTPPW